MAGTQKQAIAQVLRTCSAFSVEHAEGSTAPSGWTVLNETSSKAVVPQYRAAELVLTSIRDVNDSGPFRPMDVILDTMEQSFENAARRDESEWNLRDQNARYLSHDSGWLLIAFFDDDYSSSYCMAWHRAPDADALSFLSQPVFGIAPKQGPFGDMVRVEISNDGTFQSDSLRVEILINDLDGPWRASTSDAHPARLIPPVYIRVF